MVGHIACPIRKQRVNRKAHPSWLTSSNKALPQKRYFTTFPKDSTSWGPCVQSQEAIETLRIQTTIDVYLKNINTIPLLSLSTYHHQVLLLDYQEQIIHISWVLTMFLTHNLSHCIKSLSMKKSVKYFVWNVRAGTCPGHLCPLFSFSHHHFFCYLVCLSHRAPGTVPTSCHHHLLLHQLIWIFIHSTFPLFLYV